MSDNKKAILVTGGAGFVGSHLAEKLLQKGEEVFVIDDLSTGNSENIKHLENNPNFHFIKGSVLDEKLVSEIVAKADEVYHLAAAVGVKTIIEKPLESFLINIDGTKNVLEAAAERKIPVLITSSSEVYGKNDKLPFREEDDRVYGSAYHDRWGYGLSKGSDEFLGLAYFREKGLPVVIVRLFNVIGPRQSGSYGMVVPRFIKQALKNEPIEVYGDGGQTRCFGYVGSVINALIELMGNKEKSYGQIFNIGSEEKISIKELAQQIKALTNSNSEIKFIPYNQFYGEDFEDMRDRQPNLDRIKKAINYQPVALAESLQKTIDYFRSY
ncbi:MAG: Nucleoside-diphosphate-sugar epimerase (UDP-glucose 4-epimerase) [Candidatus Roizmanbacteria bacterium GW2011_GWC2_41_7]|uniref:Nucleoside-diphosphate-sugar epimerase (UDP-glucose 4-epimerase) n=1 Tax=Candidatus Roizmanbacteria bacterium GW2011_GWC2_41_7 TaxID=1618487 RepID=A0A0G0ZJT9_9BACT|nr:MAG: Nucleoside-diphosphate-sugar epimerase (UDP-glucose 4-epimerase) [Candidatus Roizmanbacteria bacterium GW2011_GWC2_41_7]